MISDVKILKIKSNTDDRGFFREIFRFKEQFKNIKVGQLSHSYIKRGIVKGWHGHVYQSQWNYVISGSLKVALFDNRPTSPSYKNILEIDIDKSNPTGYFFPPGVLHGYYCFDSSVQMLYVTSGVYDLQDEIRTPMNNYNFKK